MIFEQLGDSEKLTSTERQIADFILKHPKVATNFSLEELSRECFVSQASVIRFCKKLGCKGYADFKIQLASELSSFALYQQSVSVDIPIPENANCQDIAKVMYNLSHQALEAAMNDLDYDAIQRAAFLIAHADLLHLFGRGESLILAEDFHYKLLRIGIRSALDTSNGFQEAHIGYTHTAREAAMVISQYCDSQHVNYITDELVSNHIPFILLTANPNPWPYHIEAEVTLTIHNTESRYKMGSFASRTAFQYVLDCLFGQIFSLNYQRNKDTLFSAAKRKEERDYFYKRRKE